MINRRNNVFETNSSSVHTITIDTGNVNDLELQQDGYVHLSIGYYGKQFDTFNNSYDKLSYALLTVCYTHGIYLYWDDAYEGLLDNTQYDQELEFWKDCIEDLFDTEEYREIEDCVIEEFRKLGKNCHGIKIHTSDCGIDHQSQEYYSLGEFLAEHDIATVGEFIFGNYTLNTGCD